MPSGASKMNQEETYNVVNLPKQVSCLERSDFVH